MVAIFTEMNALLHARNFLSCCGSSFGEVDVKHLPHSVRVYFFLDLDLGHEADVCRQVTANLPCHDPVTGSDVYFFSRLFLDVLLCGDWSNNTPSKERFDCLKVFSLPKNNFSWLNSFGAVATNAKSNVDFTLVWLQLLCNSS